MNNFITIKFFIICLCIVSSTVLSQENSIKFAAPADKKIFVLPVPNNKIPLQSEIIITVNGIKLNNKATALTQWTNDNQATFIRLLQINVNKQNDQNPKENITYKLQWLPAKKEINTQIIKNKSLPHLVYPSAQWLAESILLHPKITQLDTSWYTSPKTLYANFVTNDLLLKQNKYPPTRASQWLFDRPRSIFQLFILTGDTKWLKEGSKLVHFYLENLDETGKFKLKENFDLKYLMPNGLLYFYLLTGDNRIKPVLKAFFEQSLNWQATYKSNYQFWTERHQAAALNIAIAYWEISGSPQAKNRIDEIIDATVQMTFSPRNEWKIIGCPQHTYKSHEGKAGNSPVCSPWMMALLGDGLWRYYRLTHDKRSAALLNAFGDFMPNYGIHFADKKLKNKVLPLYLASMDNKLLEIKNQWIDDQHVCDIAGLIGKSLYIKKKVNEDVFLLNELFNVFIQQCKDINKKYKHAKKGYLPIIPPRRFGWTYSTTSDLPWLVYWLDKKI
ncbi:hypothetical protein [Thalassotalea profundi]|uniref:Uncharacterized protein n=1 Tax=Thalassotalea profundi TaxID=2036687 RepID=A0ABQ3IQQ9_9GAMM|nr:hypothetical protein [Thalassotalea profundi]GHE89475.1 hypothetical protein GCM10011501_18790 [Thalassotalea profundi]